jgi:hypothetical protein
VIYVSVRDYDLLDLQVMLTDEFKDVFDVISRVDDHRFARSFVSDDRAVAPQWAHGKDFVNHGSIVTK